MKNLAAIIVSLMVCASMVHAGVTSGRKTMVTRKSADVYAVIGEGFLRTIGCTVKAEQMEAFVEMNHGKPWLYFIDGNGEIETGCEIVTHAVKTPAPVKADIIMRDIAVIQ